MLGYRHLDGASLATDRKTKGLRIVDALWSTFIITPITIFYWGGTWKLLDYYVIPQMPIESAYISLALGTVGCFTGYIVLPLIGTCVSAENALSWKHIIVSRVLTYILAFMVLNYWRGIWNLMDIYIGTGLKYNAICVAVGSVILLLFRSLGHVVTSPFSIEIDAYEKFYTPVTRFKTPPGRFWLYCLDCFFSLIVILGLSVQVWRGLWNVMEVFIFPHNLILSYWFSLGVGTGCALILMAGQHLFAKAGKMLLQKHWMLMFILQALIRVVESLITLLIWRGGWGLNKDYLLDSTLDAALAHGLATLGLLILQSLTSVSSLNVTVDRENPDADSFYYDTDYFIYFRNRKRQANTTQIEPSINSDERGLLGDSDDEPLDP